MSNSTVPHEPSAHEWPEVEKVELLQCYAYCLDQHNKCIENVEILLQLQMNYNKNPSQKQDEEEFRLQSEDLVRRGI